MNILELIKERIVFCDGGMGSLLQERGLRPGELPETWNVLHPEAVRAVHQEYIEAGADIITTNTFGANALKYPGRGDGGYSVEELVTAAVEQVRLAERGAGRRVCAALDIGPTGKLLEPLGDLSFDQAYELFAQTVRAGAAAGADMVLIETMSDSYEVKAAVLAAKENCSLPVAATLVFDEKGKLLTGGGAVSAVALLEGLGVDALGINCGLGPLQMEGIVRELLMYASVPVIVNPNAGLPRSENGRTVYDIDEGTFAEAMERMVRMGVRVAGGCCGTTPEHIRRLAERCAGLAPVPVTEKEQMLVTSYARAEEIGQRPVIVGERINPTGKPKLRQALKERDMEYLLREAVSQEEAGAHVLDVNVGVPGIDEAAVMEEAVREIQAVTDLPLQIDTSDISAMERALRIYNGKPLVNSVNGREEVMDAVFPLVKKYGGVAVALLLDENGIPDTAAGRLAIARKICGRAEQYGIARKNLLFDALAMTISADSRSAQVTLETVRRLREELGVRTILGVSNISFGLPARGSVNAVFYAMALENGLSAAIINPNSQEMMRAYDCYCALAGLDENCQSYIARYAGSGDGKGGAGPQAGEGKSGPGGTGASAGGAGGTGSASAADRSLGDCVRRGLKEQAALLAGELLKTEAPLCVIDRELIPALDAVGRGFEQGTVFLPQLLMSAEAAREAFGVIREKLSAEGEQPKKEGKILLATVKGDIHDIGKNIVKVLLENYGYEVLDLGRDVEPERVVRTALAEGAGLVGLSALMTTTVPAMEETIRLLRREAPHIRVMVGGAVLTKEYADQIGADAYGRDAMAAVNYAQEVFA